MKIINVDYFTLKYPLPKNYSKPFASFVTEGSIFLRVYTDIGIVGVGEPSPYGAPLKDMVKILNDELIQNWIGSNPLDIKKLTLQNSTRLGYDYLGYNALIAGFSQAIWDIFGKFKNKPLYKLLNPSSKGKIKAYASAGMWYEKTPLEEIVSEASNFFDQGFEIYKLRPETYASAGNHFQRNLNPPKVNLKRFIDLIQKINLSTNGKLKIMVDAGCRLDFDQALNLISAMSELNCFFLEEPIPRDYYQYSKLKKKSNIPLAGGESLSSNYQFIPWVENDALDYLQPDANLAGISEILKIDKLAQTYKKKIILHNWTNDINNAANAHIGTALNSCTAIEANLTLNPLKNKLVNGAVELKGDMFILSDRPGLGIELNDSAINKYSFKCV